MALNVDWTPCPEPRGKTGTGVQSVENIRFECKDPLPLVGTIRELPRLVEPKNETLVSNG